MSALSPVLGAILLVLTPAAHGMATNSDDAPRRLLVATADPDPTELYLVGELRVTHTSIQGQSGGASLYFDIENRGQSPDHLVSAKLALADQVAIVGGPMAGTGEGLLIPAGGTIDLTAGGPHLELKGLHGALKAGDRMRGTLEFETAGPLPVEFTVKADPAAPKP